MTVAPAIVKDLGGTLGGTLGEALEYAARAPLGGVRLLDRQDRERWLSWTEIHSRAELVAGGLRRQGVRFGDRVALVYPTSEELLAAFFGTVLSGAVPALIAPPPRLGNPTHFLERIAGQIEAIEARLVLGHSRLAARLEGVSDCDVMDLESLPNGHERLVSSATPESLAMVQFTSGTTCSPRPVALSHASVLEQARQLNARWVDSAETQHSGLSWLPLHHDMGLIGCLFVALERPAELTLMPPELFAARPATWLRAISRFSATVSPATNFAYAYCVEQIRDEELEGVDLSSWEVALNGAESVVADVMRSFIQRFEPWGLRSASLTPVYGLAEASLAVTFSEVQEEFHSRRFSRTNLEPGDQVVEERDGRELVSVGRPLDGFSTSIRDAAGEVLEDGRIGIIWVRGPSLMEGYLGQEKASLEALQKGWLNTGDLGFLHKGELYVSGRAKDLIIVRGRNLSPEEIEQSVASITGVQAGGVAALGHLSEGSTHESVLLFVEGVKRACTKQIERACVEQVLGATGVEVDQVVVLSRGDLPRTSSGKVRRGELLRRYLATAAGSAASAASSAGATSAASSARE